MIALNSLANLYKKKNKKTSSHLLYKHFGAVAHYVFATACTLGYTICAHVFRGRPPTPRACPSSDLQFMSTRARVPRMYEKPTYRQQHWRTASSECREVRRGSAPMGFSFRLKIGGDFCAGCARSNPDTQGVSCMAKVVSR